MKNTFYYFILQDLNHIIQVDQLEKNKERTERELKTQHPLLSRIRPWLKKQLKRADAEHASQHTWDAHIKAIGNN